MANVARPGGNITGQSFFGAELRAKRIELLKELMPRLTQVAVILNAANSAAETDYQTMEATAQSLNVKLQPFRLREPSELVSAFERMEQTHIEAIETGDDPLSTLNTREHLLLWRPEGGFSRLGAKIFPAQAAR